MTGLAVGPRLSAQHPTRHFPLGLHVEDPHRVVVAPRREFELEGMHRERPDLSRAVARRQGGSWGRRATCVAAAHGESHGEAHHRALLGARHHAAAAATAAAGKGDRNHTAGLAVVAPGRARDVLAERREAPAAAHGPNLDQPVLAALSSQSPTRGSGQETQSFHNVHHIRSPDKKGGAHARLQS